jgi:hypothetical protein
MSSISRTFVIVLLFISQIESFQVLETTLKSDKNLIAVKRDLHHHPIYESIKSMEDMKVFMESHVWAVWDFMTLLKRLQREFTNTNLIWTPRSSAENARFIVEICKSEESDEFENGSHISHFELYLLAMEDIGANTQPIREFVRKLEQGVLFSDALHDAPISDGLKTFVSYTVSTALHGTTIQATSAFFFGREDPIPEMFSKFLKHFSDSDNLRNFKHYLARHIEVDGSDHGPKAMMLLDSITNQDPEKINESIRTGVDAITHRIMFWNDILARINHSRDEM